MNTSSAVTHLVYIPGLGDGYDGFRRHALKKWKQDGLIVSFAPMRWRDTKETYQQKVARIYDVIDSQPNARTVLVGESAGGAVAVALSFQRSEVVKVITICGKNRRANRVAASVYERNPAFKEAMIQADACVEKLQIEKTHRNYVTFYSPLDTTVHRVDTELPGGVIKRLPPFGHLVTIALVLYVFYRRIIKEASA